jgi:CheY-like chemotaxis protein
LTGFAGRRVLIVEDEGPVAIMLEDLLEELGFAIAGSFARLAPAIAALDSIRFDFAVLDINLAGETSFDLARTLRERRIPYLFSTGYGAIGLPADLQHGHVLTKPFSANDLREAVHKTLE